MVLFHRVCVVLLAALGVVACRQQATPETPKADEPEQKHPTVELDLSPSGIAATIRGPEGAKASAADGHVTVDADPDFHMEIYKGGLDPLAEKADIVRRWGPSFRRYVQDDGNTVIYETEVAGDNRFHFFSSGEVGGLFFHCKSTKNGVETITAVQLMILGCLAIEAHEDNVAEPEPAKAETAKTPQ
jgi:hypothetical protein